MTDGHHQSSDRQQEGHHEDGQEGNYEVEVGGTGASPPSSPISDKMMVFQAMVLRLVDVVKKRGQDAGVHRGASSMVANVLKQSYAAAIDDIFSSGYKPPVTKKSDFVMPAKEAEPPKCAQPKTPEAVCTPRSKPKARKPPMSKLLLMQQAKTCMAPPPLWKPGTPEAAEQEAEARAPEQTAPSSHAVSTPHTSSPPPQEPESDSLSPTAQAEATTPPKSSPTGRVDGIGPCVNLNPIPVACSPPPVHLETAKPALSPPGDFPLSPPAEPLPPADPSPDTPRASTHDGPKAELHAAHARDKQSEAKTRKVVRALKPAEAAVPALVPEAVPKTESQKRKPRSHDTCPQKRPEALSRPPVTKILPAEPDAETSPQRLVNMLALMLQKILEFASMDAHIELHMHIIIRRHGSMLTCVR